VTASYTPNYTGVRAGVSYIGHAGLASYCASVTVAVPQRLAGNLKAWYPSSQILPGTAEELEERRVVREEVERVITKDGSRLLATALATRSQASERVVATPFSLLAIGLDLPQVSSQVALHRQCFFI
jgi:hypothetical protein